MRTVWICFDGIDATGKTTLADFAEKKLRLAGAKVSRIQEWSDTAFGDFIRDRFLTRRFFTIGRDENPYDISSACALAADLCARAEAAMIAEHEEYQYVVAEHHWISYIAYYLPIISRAMDKAYDVEGWLTNMVSTSLAPLRMPEICFALTTDQDTLDRRTVARGDPALTRDEIDVLLQAQAKIVELGQASGFPVINTVGRPPEDTIEEVFDWLRKAKLLQEGH